MDKASSTLAPESPKMTDLRQQLHEASTIEAQRQVMINTMLAVRANEISTTESKVLNKEFTKINDEAREHLKEERERLKETHRAAD